MAAERARSKELKKKSFNFSRKDGLVETIGIVDEKKAIPPPARRAGTQV